LGQRVQRLRTPVSEPQMMQAVIEVWRELFGFEPTKEQVSLVLAQNSLETGNRKSMWNYNVGNITTDGKGQFDYFDDLQTDEQVKPGVWEKKNLKYRAYPSLQEGVKDYLRFLSGKKYQGAFQHILQPNPTAFSKALKQSGYYTANEAPYTSAISRLFKQISGGDSFELAQSGQAGKIPTLNDLGKAKPANDIDSILGGYLKQIAADNRALYRKHLPAQDILIRVAGEKKDALEFGRFLSLALNEEFGAIVSVHDGENVEVESKISGPALSSLGAVEEFVELLKNEFPSPLETKILINKKSEGEMVSPQTLESNHRSFMISKIAEKNKV